MKFSKALLAEAVGTALLLAIIVGSGIMGERLAQGNAAVALLANAIATGAGLYVLIEIFAAVSGAHFNPAVTFVMARHGKLSAGLAVKYIVAQVCGALIGVCTAHAMFGLPIVQASQHGRTSLGEGLGEIVATFRLLLTILLSVRYRPAAVAATVAAYITSAYWFTSSTSFANPAVTIARALTDTFAGIAPLSVPLFIGAQMIGALAAAYLANWLIDLTPTDSNF